MTLSDLVEMVKTGAARVVPAEEHAAILHCAHDGGSRLALFLLDLAEPGQIQKAVPAVLAKEQPDAYVLISEARFKKSTSPVLPGFRRGNIGGDPSNPECLVIFGFDRVSREKAGWFAEVHGTIPNRTMAEWRNMSDGMAGALVTTDW